MAWKRKLLALMVASVAILGVACDDAGEGGLDNGGDVGDTGNGFDDGGLDDDTGGGLDDDTGGGLDDGGVDDGGVDDGGTGEGTDEGL